MKIFYTLAVKLAALMLSVSAAGAVYSLNPDWRFTKAPKTIPLAQAKDSVETNGVKVEDPAFDDSVWEAVSVPHPINAHDSFDDRAMAVGACASVSEPRWKNGAKCAVTYTFDDGLADQYEVAFPMFREESWRRH